MKKEHFNRMLYASTIIIIIILCSLKMNEVRFANRERNLNLERKNFTKHTINTMAALAKKESWQSCSNRVDGWENPIEFVRIDGEDRTTYIITSYGEDGKPSNDDISVTAIDIHTGVVIGKWIGSKTKELATGIKISITTTNKTTGTGWSFFKKLGKNEELEAKE